MTLQRFTPGALAIPISPLEPMVRQLQAAPMTQETYEMVKGYWLRSTKPAAHRNTLALMVMRNTGFRPCEIVVPQKGDDRKHFLQAPLLAGHVVQHGPMYWVNVLRAKKRERPEYDPVIINPVLGQQLVAYITGNGIAANAPLFAFNTRQLANIWYEACDAALGFRKPPTSMRKLYISTVARLAHEIVGYTPEDMAIASVFVGHEDVRTTRQFYEKFTPEQRRAIQERIPV